MKWKQGRQNSGYEVMTLFKFLSMDGYLIRYPDNTAIPPHVDPVPDKKHYRLNIVIKKPESGGVFYGKTIFRFGRVIFFRPDINEHCITKCEGERIVLSLGVAI